MPCYTSKTACRCGVVVDMKCLCCGVQHNDSCDDDFYDRKEPFQILLLGAAETGKSTMMRQMKIIHEKGMKEEVRASHKQHVVQNVYNCLKRLMLAANQSGISWSTVEAQNAANTLSDISLDSWKVVESEEKGAMDLISIPKVQAYSIETLWADKTAQICWNKANEFNLPDSTEYYLQNIKRISEVAYIPTLDDILRLRLPTEAVSVYKFSQENKAFQVTDVGGQRGQRRRWIRIFSGIKAVIFVAALSEYDQYWGEEEGGVNRLSLSLKLFRETLGYSELGNASFILFLNKKDIFTHKIKHSPLKRYFPRYDGPPNSATQANRFIEEQFRRALRSVQPDSQLYVHVTTATNTPQFKFIFAAVSDHILWWNMRELFNAVH